MMLRRIYLWLLRGWPVLAVLPLFAIYLLLLELPLWTTESLNKYFSLVLQISGGLIILDSIDSNLGQFKKRGLWSLFLNWLRSFPVIQKQQTSSDVRVGFPLFGVSTDITTSNPQEFVTIDEKIDYFMKQVTELQKKQAEDKNTLLKKIAEIREELIGNDKSTEEKVSSLSGVVESVAIGSIKMQLFGFMLLISSALLGFIS